VKPRHLYLAENANEPDPLDPGGDSLDDVNGEDDDPDQEDDGTVPFFVDEPERWEMCEEIAEKMTNGDVELTPFVARHLYLSAVPTDEDDTIPRVDQVGVGYPPSPDVPDGIED
jgi:hypothetical protein